MNAPRPLTVLEAFLLIMLLAAPLGVMMVTIPRLGLYAVIASLLWGVPAGGLILAAVLAVARGRVGR